MKTIGFIDYYLDEWHANQYPRLIRESRFKDQFDVALAWEETAKPGKKPLADWCREQQVQPAASLAEVVERCDAIVVLSPDNGERHEDLADLPLRSGKPVYIDKPFALTRAAAERMVAKARQHGTPLMSCSALRFSPTLIAAVERLGPRRVEQARSHGPGPFAIYAVHQLEMLVMALGTGAVRVRRGQEGPDSILELAYDDSRRGRFAQSPGNYEITLATAGETIEVKDIGDVFSRFIDGMLAFFDTGRSPILITETIAIAALIEAGTVADERPGEWLEVPVSQGGNR
ncbi:Gfo/Idh/MocA family oxidoreductase [bacterium]|nr:Gfo/Idh/MocA family oxidoreductase [bacterium]